MLSYNTIFSLVSCFVNDAYMSSDSDKVNRVKLCLNNVLEDIACDYINCVFQEKITMRAGQKFTFDLLEKNIISVKKLIKNGNEVDFTLYCDGISVKEDGEYMICYNYLPAVDLENDKIEYFSPRLTNRIVSYGVTCEYLLLEGRYDEAGLWESRYRDALKGLSRLKKNVKVKRRVWA